MSKKPEAQGRDVKRSYDVKRLFDRQLDKVDASLEPAERQRAAACLMDKLVGSAWRGEAQLPGVEFVDIETTGKNSPPSSDPQDFYDRLQSAMVADGLDFRDEGGLDEADAESKRDTSGLRDKIMARVAKVLDGVLGAK